MSSVEKVILSLGTIYDVFTALEKIGEVTDLEMDEYTGMDIKELKRENKGFKIEFKDVCFKYPGQEKYIFKDLNITINPSENVAITGFNSSGKSTFLYLLFGLYQLESGYIAFNDVPLGNLNPGKLRTEIGDCLMNELLFEATLLENITMGRKKASFENVEWAVKNVGLSDFVKSLPKGYDTDIQQQGRQFSKGVINKILLARSIVTKPHLLLIKDVFSFIGDEKSKIMDFLFAPENPWTLVIATDDKYVLEKMNRKYLINSGKLKEILHIRLASSCCNACYYKPVEYSISKIPSV